MADKQLEFPFYQKPLCEEDCWHYGLFGDQICCDAKDSWGFYQEPITEGELCLHPDKKDTSPPTFTGSLLGLCAALEGSVIIGGPHNNQQLVQILMGSGAEKP